MSNVAQHAELHQEGSGTTPLVRIPYRRIGLYVALVDAAIIFFSSVSADLIYGYLEYGSAPDAGMSSGVGLVACFVYWLVVRSVGFYDLPSLLAPQSRWSPILLGWAAVILVLPLILFLLKVGSGFSRGSMIAFAFTGLVLLILFRLLAVVYLRGMMVRGWIAGRRAVIIGESDELGSLNATSLLYLFGIEEAGRIVLNELGDEPSRLPPSAIAKIDRAVELARSSGAREFVLVLDWSRSAVFEAVRNRLRYSPLPARLLPDRNIRSIVSKRHLFAASALSVELQREPLTRTERTIKRFLDICGASAILLLLSPLLVMVAVAVKVGSPGPAIFRQRRNGFNGRPFVIYKFRTMNVLEDGGVIRQAKKQDPRVTSIGMLLRQSSIDELPQLFNVLKGDMSLVGPRPHAIAHDDEYGKTIAKYAYRHHVKPGVTGLAQVNGCRGETEHLDQMKKRIDWDLSYIDNWSVLLDLKILIRTTVVPLLDRDAY
jgi:Undecaprenyl-phosphate glucose phosphotransferase